MENTKELIITKQENLSPNLVRQIQEYFINEQKRLYNNIKIKDSKNTGGNKDGIT